jgi:radical SAM protein with 4Fe4S-binding SPASM domain
VSVSLPEITFAQFAEARGLGGVRVPLEGTLETTFRCNLRCAHCYVNEPVGASEIAAREVPLPRLLALIDEIAEAGNLFLLLTGGEVLVRTDFRELYLHARSRGLLVTVFTNGTLVTDEIADLFAEHRPELVEITLYGMTKATYERVTQIPGSYEKCLAGIRRLVDRGVHVGLKTIALSWNFAEVRAMQSYAESLGLPFRFDSALNARVDCGANRNGELQLDPRKAIELDLADPERLRELKEFCERFARPDRERDTEHVYTCGAGYSSFTVDPYGQLQLCQLSRRSGYDLKEGTFAQGWDEHFPRLRERKWRTNGVCRACNLLSLCSNCSGAAELETGDPEGFVPQFCELAHLRAWAAMGETSGHREDASCCKEKAVDAARGVAPPTSGCGSPEPAGERLIQIQRRPSVVRARP